MSETNPTLQFDRAVMAQKGECRNHDPEMFFPSAKGPSNNNALADAAIRTACSVCPVYDECLSYALSADETGVWGGTFDRARRAAKKRAAQEIHNGAIADTSDSADIDTLDEETDQPLPSAIPEDRVLVRAFEIAKEMRYKKYGF